MTLIELLHLLRRRWYLLVLFPLLFGAAGAAYCWGVLTDDYTASVSLYVLTKATDSNPANNNTAVTSSDAAASQQLANDMAALVKTEKITNAAAAKLGMQELKGFDVSVGAQSTNRVITVSVTGKDPRQTATVANEIAKQSAASAVELMGLEAVNVFENAAVPDKPSGPNRVQYTLIAALAGLFLAIVVIVVADMLDNTVRSSEQAEEQFGLPVIGRMPTVKN